MKKLSIGVGFGMSFLFAGYSVARAQVPVIGVYFGADQYKNCQGVGVVDTLTVLGYNHPSMLCDAQFAIDYPPAVAYLGDLSVAGTLTIGNSLMGIIVNWVTPPSVLRPVLILRVTIMWNCDSCDPEFINNLICPVSHPVTGFLGFHNCSGTAFPAYGICATVCPYTNPAEETSWGRVKALY